MPSIFTFLHRVLQAVAVFRQIPANSFARDLRSFHAVASATDSWARLLQLCINLEELNLQTDVVLGNMLCSCSRRDWQSSLLASQIFLQKSLEPDSVTASALASAHGYLHRWRHSMTVLQMAPMNAQAVAADTEYVRASCLDACAKRFAWEAASSLSAPRPSYAKCGFQMLSALVFNIFSSYDVDIF